MLGFRVHILNYSHLMLSYCYHHMSRYLFVLYHLHSIIHCSLLLYMTRYSSYMIHRMVVYTLLRFLFTSHTVHLSLLTHHHSMRDHYTRMEYHMCRYLLLSSCSIVGSYNLPAVHAPCSDRYRCT